MTADPNNDQTRAPTSREAAPNALTDSHPAIQIKIEESQLPAASVEQIGEYKILGILGSGGMGIVYKAFDKKLGRIVALKMLHVGVNPEPEVLVRFRGEAEMLGSLQHAHIVQVFDFGMHNKVSPYLVLEYVDGGSLERQLQGKPQYPRKAAEMVVQLAQGMHAAHEKGIIHRDLKPANVLVSPDGIPKITDFGLAKRLQISAGLTPTHAVMGTPSYMAPEQAAGKADVSAAADIYALGAILYEMLTGRPPFLGATLPETLEMVQLAEPAPPTRLVPNLPRDLTTVCLKCLHKSPGRRYASAQELADDLKCFLEGLPVKARREHSFERIVRIVARYPQRVALVGAGLLVILMAIGGLWYKQGLDQKVATIAREQEHEREKARQLAEIEKARQDKLKMEQDFDNLKEMLVLTMSGDLNTPAGLKHFEDRLDDRTKNLSENDPEKSVVLAGAYYKLADKLRREQGELDWPLAILNDKAKKLAETAGKAEYRNLSAQLLHPRIYQTIGLLRSEIVSEQEQAVKDCQTALKLLDGFSDKAKQTPEFIRLKAETLHDLAVAMWKKTGGDEKERRKNREDAIGTALEAMSLIRQSVVASEPSQAEIEQRKDDENLPRKESIDDRRNLARTLAFLGNLYLDHQKRAEADASYWESHEIRQSLAEENPGDYDIMFQLARSWANFGRYQTREGNLGTALHFYRKSLKHREDLNQKQPDNKEFVLELASVLNRIAELELFVADQERDPRKKQSQLAILEDRLSRCSKLLTGLFDTLKENSRNDRAIATRVNSFLGECHSLRARAGMMSLSMVSASELDPKKIDETRMRARAATDAFRAVSDRRRLTEDEIYHSAASRFVTIDARRLQKGGVDSTERTMKAYREETAIMLRELICDQGFARLAPQQICRDFAFRSVRPEIEDWLKTLPASQYQMPRADTPATVPPTVKKL